MNQVLFKQQFCLLKSMHRHFSTSLNVRVLQKDARTNEVIDQNLNRYGKLHASFILKRRIVRSEIWPKMHIVDEVPLAERHHLSCQKIYLMKKSMRDSLMGAIVRKDPSQINSSFIISMFCEDYFKEMMDQYTSKVLLCGKAPADEAAQNAIEEQIYKLYKIFYFGETNTPLEREIENSYLSQKQSKYMRYSNQPEKRRNEYLKCKWREQDQRLIEEYENWPIQDINLLDVNYRPYYQPLNILNRLPHKIKQFQLEGPKGFFERLQFNWLIKKQYSSSNRSYYEWILGKLFTRIVQWTKCLEFTQNLNIPHDYMIEAQILQLHFWMVIDRLKQLNTTQSLHLAKLLQFAIVHSILQEAKSVNLKKSNVLVTSIQQMMDMNAKILDIHFNKAEMTKSDHYKGIDAMVWSIVFAQKVHRYSNEVYLFSEYLIQNYLQVQKHTQQQIFDGVVEFDTFLIKPRYKELITAVNPPLSDTQFSKQFNSNNPDKEYYYSKIQNEMEEKMPVEQFLGRNRNKNKFSLNDLLEPFYRVKAKYFNLQTLEHYESMDKMKKSEEKKAKTSSWKSHQDSLKQVDREFEDASAAKTHRRRNQNHKN